MIRLPDASLPRTIVRALLRLYPLHRGRSRITRQLMTRFSIGDHQTVRRAGFTVTLDLRQTPSQQMYWFGDWEPATNRLIHRTLAAGGTGFDIGANIGLTTLEMAKAVGADGAIHSFEPVARNFQLLETNVRMNHLSSSVILNQLALGDDSPVLRFATDGDGALAHVTHEGPETAAVTLDEYVAKAGLDRIDLIKIDVEGFEISVLNGARNTLSRLRPTLIVECAERHLARYSSTPRELLEILSSLGYECRHSGNPTNENLLCIPHHASRRSA